MTAPICPYCGSTAKLIDSAEIYGGRSFGPAWACANYPTCDAYVGCHGRSTTPLGRLANYELRQWKKNAHAAFDRLWKTHALQRSEAYAWLAEQLQLTPDQCHIGMFDVDVCQRVVELSREHLKLRSEK